jgi:hypothetical protein
MFFRRTALGLMLLLAGFAGTSWAMSRFQFHEMYRIPFGSSRNALGTAIKNGGFQYPRDFTLDASGRCYIFDTKKHRIARYSALGQFQIGFNYPASAEQVFAHPDSKENLWLVISDPTRGTFYGVYDASGKQLREGVFGQYDRFHMYLDDESVLHVVLSSRQHPGRGQNFILHEPSLLMKKVSIAPPPESHHELRKKDRTYYIDAVPGSSEGGTPPIQRITDAARRPVAQIRGEVIYITPTGEIYTRTGDCDIHVYSAEGALEGHVTLPGLPTACRSIRFDADGSIYELDGIPDAAGHYTPDMPGMRLLRWDRS